MIADFCSLVKANRGRENRGKEKRINTRKNYGSEVNSIARRGQGAIAPCRVQGQRPCWGLGQRPNCYTVKPTQREKSSMAPWSQAAKRPCAQTPAPAGAESPIREKSQLWWCALRRGQGGDRRLRLFPLPPCRLRRGETLCNTKINLLKPTKPQTSLSFAPRRIFPMQKIPRLSHNRRRKLMQTLLEK